MLWFFLTTVVIIFVAHGLLSIAHPYPLDYGEAPLIDQAVRLATGENIYRTDLSTPPFVIANYPPLYVVSLIPVLNWFDNPFHIARVISFIAVILSAGFIGLTVQTFTKDRLAALVAAAFLLASPYVVQWSTLARIDSLALAFASAAIFVFARWPRYRWAWVGGGLLLVAAAYTRQSYALAAPLAGFVWLWTQDRRKAIFLALLVGGLGIGLFLLLNALTDGGFFYNIVTANVNEFGWDRLKNHLGNLWNTHWIVLSGSILFLAIGWKNQKSWPLMATFLVGAFGSALTIGKIGSNINYFLELSAALALIAGMYVFWTRPHPWHNVAAIFLITIQLGMMLRSTMNTEVDGILAQRTLDVSALMLLEQKVQDLPDPVLADEYMGMLTLHDQPLYMQPFEVSQLANQGDWDQKPLLEDIKNGVFGGILIHHFGAFPVYQERWTPEMLAAIERYYRPVRILAGTVVYEPRSDGGVGQLPVPSPFSSAGSIDWDGQTVSLGTPGIFSSPSIAVNPTNPEHLAVLTTQLSRQNCELPNCKIDIVYDTSMDSGQSWDRTATFSYSQQIMYAGLAAFDPEGVLYMLGVRNDVVTVDRTTAQENYETTQRNFEEATRSQVFARPWLQVNPQTGELFLSLDAQEGNRLYVTPSLIRSQDGVSWSTTARADQHISISDISSSRASAIEDIRVLFGAGQNLSLVWVWDWVPLTWPRTVWTAASSDGGRTFGEPTPILDTWGPINVASEGGQFAIVYHTGSEKAQELAVATSTDSGRTWQSAVASGGVPLYFDPGRAAVIDMAPNGTIDLLFFAHTGNPGDCLLDLQRWQLSRLSGRPDECSYDVYYTFSQDGGSSFADPLKLNDQPVKGEEFAVSQGILTANFPISIASGDEFVFPVWIETPSPGSTQVMSTRIAR